MIVKDIWKLCTFKILLEWYMYLNLYVQNTAYEERNTVS